MQAERAAVGRGVFAIRVHGAGKGLAAFGDLLAEVTLHQAQPVAIDHHLVVSIDSGDGVFTVHDSGQGCFHQHVFDAGGIGLADRAGRVDLDFKMQAVMFDQHGGRCRRITLVADQLRGVAQARAGAVFEGDLQGTADDGVGR